MSDKIRAKHLERKAVLYVRQSSLAQVSRSEESRRLQYAMKMRLEELGWKQVEVVDEDLGCSAAGTTTRTGFERMVAEVCMGKVGAVAAREVSRFARNSREWQQLVEVCRMVDTLLVDQDSVYDPRGGNDRLLLGLKGSLNEYELDLLRLRAMEARNEKAKRGELIVVAPAGYVNTEDHGLVKDPDARVQETLRRVFAKFLEFGSARQTALWFNDQGLELPRKNRGPSGWETVWRRATYQATREILGNPVYAGAYAFGRTEVTVQFENGAPQRKRKRRPVEKWLTLIYDHHEGYVSREDFERIQEMISENAQAFPGSGAAKRGPALLTGLLRCHRCGRKLTVAYSGRSGNVARYACHRGDLNYAEPRCITLGSSPIDDAVSREVLKVMQPGAIDAAAMAAKTIGTEQREMLDAWWMDLEAARYAANRAAKQFDAVDPENRLVADELERRWNVALEKARSLEEKIAVKESELDSARVPDPEAFERLAGDVDLIWNDPQTDVRLKKRILRTLIEEIVVDVDRDVGESALVIHWKGGVHTELQVKARRRGQNSLHTKPEIVDAVRKLALVCSDEIIAGVLNRNGLRTGNDNRWTRERVTSLRCKRSIPKHSERRQEEAGWMTRSEAAGYLGVSSGTLARAVERGELEVERPLSDGPWIFRREELDGPRGRAVVERARAHERGRQDPGFARPDQLTLFDETT